MAIPYEAVAIRLTLHVAREGRTLTDFHCTVEARAEFNVRFGLATE